LDEMTLSHKEETVNVEKDKLQKTEILFSNNLTLKSNSHRKKITWCSTLYHLVSYRSTKRSFHNVR
jgi:hypothetical protein